MLVNAALHKPTWRAVGSGHATARQVGPCNAAFSRLVLQLQITISVIVLGQMRD